jgi:hypothetical protein
MRRYIVGAVLGALLVLGVVACTSGAQAGDGQPGTSNGGLYRDTYHKMPDGRTVYCLYIEGHVGGYSSGNTPAFECDFDHAVVHP